MDNMTFEEEEDTARREEADEIAPLTGWGQEEDLPNYNDDEGFVADDGDTKNDAEFAAKERQRRKQNLLDRARLLKEKNNAAASGGAAIQAESEADTPMQDVDLVESIEREDATPEAVESRQEVQHLEFAQTDSHQSR